jgi:uncharacterized protein YjbI with pentapeptide repeats
MTKESSEPTQDLASYAAFDLDDLLAEIQQKDTSKKEVTAYLDRNFIVKSLDYFKEELKYNKQEFYVDNQIDFTDYNFTGADLRGFLRKELDLINFNGCDISFCKLDRISLDYFKEYIKKASIIYQSLNLDGAFLGPIHTKRTDLGIECYISLNLSDLNFSGTSFKNADIEEIILINTNISSCDFTGAENMDAHQFAFSIGYESAKFFSNPEENEAFIAKIKELSQNIDAQQYFSSTNNSMLKNWITRLAQVTNVIDD